MQPMKVGTRQSLRSRTFARAQRRSIRPGLESLESRLAPAIEILGTPGPDILTARFVPDEEPGLYRGEIILNGTVAASFLGFLWETPSPSIFLPEQLVVDLRGGNDRVDLSVLRDPSGLNLPTIIRGGAGSDVILGTAGHDRIYGGPGADRLSGGIDEDFIFADNDDQSVVGGGGGDTLGFESFSGNLVVTDDTLLMNGRRLSASAGTFGGFLALNITGSSGSDSFSLENFTGAFVRVSAGPGPDLIRLGKSSAEVNAGDGNDRVIYASALGQQVNILGGRGDDRITLFGSASVDGGVGNDVIDARSVGFGYEGRGVNLIGGPGADILYGSNYNDVLEGGNGNDQLRARAGQDQLIGGAGADVLFGGDDNDLLQADGDDVAWDGGAGIDALFAGTGYQRANINAVRAILDGTRITLANLESLELGGSARNDVLDASGFGGIVRLSGFAGNDVLRAGVGNAILDGGEGNDQLTAGAGDDELTGGAGADSMAGGAGKDSLFADREDPALSGGPGLEDYLDLTGGTTAVAITDTMLTIDGVAYPSHGFEALSFLGSEGDDVVSAANFGGSINFDGLMGRDLVETGAGADQVVVRDGSIVRTGAGDDFVSATTGVIELNLGSGSDRVEVGGAFGVVVIVTDTSWSNDGVITTLGGVEFLSIVTGDISNEVDSTAFSGLLGLTDGGGDNIVRTGPGGSSLNLNSYYLRPGNNTVYGGSGVDFVYIAGGTNWIDGGAGDDFLQGGSGSDTILGGEGNDILVGASGDDRLEGGIGNDDLEGSEGLDTMLGGQDTDRFRLDGDPAVQTVEATLWDFDAGAGESFF
ncbi:MAG: calcium-binding protein [Gemmataceae bacterium]